MNLAPWRRILESAVNEGLGAALQGKVVIDGIERVDLRGVDVRSIVALDPRGGQVIRVSGIRARADLRSLARKALFGSGELAVSIAHLRVDDAAVLVEPGPTGQLTIAEAFAPRGPAAPPRPGARPVRIAFEQIEIGHAWVHGAIAPPRVLDADVSHLRASFHAGPDGAALDLDQ